MTPYLKKNPLQKRTGGVAQSVGPEYKPQYRKKKKKTLLESDEGLIELIEL
jgi:hypothetical protein